MKVQPSPLVERGIYTKKENAPINGLWIELTVGKDPTRYHKTNYVLTNIIMTTS